MKNYRTKIKAFRDLDAWKEAHLLAVDIYSETKRFPREELFGLSSQMRRSAVSVTSNIAEGFNRFSIKEKTQFYAIALGSVSELDSQLDIAKDVNYMNKDDYLRLRDKAEQVHKIITGLIRVTKQR